MFTKELTTYTLIKLWSKSELVRQGKRCVFFISNTAKIDNQVDEFTKVFSSSSSAIDLFSINLVSNKRTNLY